MPMQPTTRHMPVRLLPTRACCVDRSSDAYHRHDMSAAAIMRIRKNAAANSGLALRLLPAHQGTQASARRHCRCAFAGMMIVTMQSRAQGKEWLRYAKNQSWRLVTHSLADGMAKGCDCVQRQRWKFFRRLTSTLVPSFLPSCGSIAG